MLQIITHRRFWLGVSGVSLVYLLVLVFTTTPQRVGPSGVVSWFVAAYVFTVAALVAANGYIFGRKTLVSWRAISRQALWGVGIVSLLALRSLGQLQLRDTLLIVLLLATLGLYLRRSS